MTTQHLLNFESHGYSLVVSQFVLTPKPRIQMITNIYFGEPHSTLNEILVFQRAVCVYNWGPFRTACPKQVFCPHSNSQAKVESVTPEMIGLSNEPNECTR